MTIDFARALASPTSVFDRPADVVTSQLSWDEKRQILEQWEIDSRALQVAAEENMSGGERARLGEVRDALRRISPEILEPAEQGAPAPTKAGGNFT